ncbi:hypothetical protein LCGC14_2897590, partial [marine sediment metagenome]
MATSADIRRLEKALLEAKKSHDEATEP